MKNYFLAILFFLSSFNSFAQYRATRQNGVLQTTEDYVTNSPGNTIATSKLIARYKDSTEFALHYNNIKFAKYNSSKDDGTPTTILWTDSDGNIKKSTIPSWITTEVDPEWNAEKTNYYTKTLSDARYLQSFTESDPNVPIYSKNLTAFSVIQASTDVLYKSIFYIPDFIDITSKPTTLSGYGITDAYPLAGNPSNFLITEVDGSITNELEPVGIIEFYSGTSAPTGYLLCDGSEVSRTTYSSLFTITSTTYGSGDGSTTFNLPDLRQRFPLTKAISGTGSTLGATGGNIDHLHSVDPPNTTSGTPSGTSGQLVGVINVASATHTHDVNIASFNSGTANPPYLVLNAIIKY